MRDGIAKFFRIRPFGYKKLEKEINNDSTFCLLDIGSGNHSATKFKKSYPHCEYYGLDISKNYNNSADDFRLMKDFYEMDLTLLDYSQIPDDYFDVIYMSHIIEHLHNGEDVIASLLTKLKQNGIVYIEYPSVKSVRFPHMKGTLNFYDDSTHCRLYQLCDLLNLLTSHNCCVLSAGTRRDMLRIALMPLIAIAQKVSYGHVKATAVWDCMGFAEYIIVKKGAYRYEKANV